MAKEDISEATSRPKRQTTAEGTIEERPIKETIEGERAVETADAIVKPHRGLFVSRTRPGGAC